MKKIIVGMVVLLLIGRCGIYLFFHDSNSQKIDSNSQKFEKYIMTNINNKSKSVIDFKTDFPFEWEKLYVFGAYTSQEEMYKKVGFKWSTSEIMTEVYYKIVFVNKEKVVCDIDISIGNFNIQSKSYPVDKDHSKFKIQRNNEMTLF